MRGLKAWLVVWVAVLVSGASRASGPEPAETEPKPAWVFAYGGSLGLDAQPQLMSMAAHLPFEVGRLDGWYVGVVLGGSVRRGPANRFGPGGRARLLRPGSMEVGSGFSALGRVVTAGFRRDIRLGGRGSLPEVLLRPGGGVGIAEIFDYTVAAPTAGMGARGVPTRRAADLGAIVGTEVVVRMDERVDFVGGLVACASRSGEWSAQLVFGTRVAMRLRRRRPDAEAGN